MGKSNYWSIGLLNLLFNAAALATVAQNNATSPITNIYAALHTADPGASGSQTTNEVTYTSYARVAVARTTSGWPTTTTQTISPAASITFPQGTGGSGTATYFSVGTATSGAGNLLYSGTISPNIVTGNGITPQLTTATTITEA